MGMISWTCRSVDLFLCKKGHNFLGHPVCISITDEIRTVQEILSIALHTHYIKMDIASWIYSNVISMSCVWTSYAHIYTTYAPGVHSSLGYVRA